VCYGSSSPSRSPSISPNDRDRFLAYHYTIYSNLFASLFMEHLPGWRLLSMCKPWWSLLAHIPLLIGHSSQLLQSSPRSSPYSPK
jgi:hypothetical protein